MLDKIIHVHLDEMDKIEADIERDIDELIANIDINAIIQNPLFELTSFVEAVKKIIEEEYIPKAIEEGQKFSKDIEESKKDIIVPDTNDSKLNEGLADDKRRD